MSDGSLSLEIQSTETINLKTFKSETVFVGKRGDIIQEKIPVKALYFEEELIKGTDPLKMRRIPAGEFWMGTEEEEIERLVKKFDWEYFRSENPQHKVTIKQDFYMSQTPITQGQWKAVTRLPQVGKELTDNPSRFEGDDNLPVEKVSWYDAIEFCARLSQHTGKNYRLPSEAQWEYACRSVSSEQLSVTSKELTVEEWNKKYYQPFHFGETITDKLANYAASEIYEEESAGESREKTTPVGQFYPNAFGLYDMHGNVWEWCADPWHENYNNAPEDGSVWDEEAKDDRYTNYANTMKILLKIENIRVIRGGSWRYRPYECRSACRDGYDTGDDGYNVGFRVVCG